MTTKKKSTKEEPAGTGTTPGKKAASGGAVVAAQKILEDESPQSKIAEHGETMMEGPRTAATQSARRGEVLPQATERPGLWADAPGDGQAEELCGRAPDHHAIGRARHDPVREQPHRVGPRTTQSATPANAGTANRPSRSRLPVSTLTTST